MLNLATLLEERGAHSAGTAGGDTVTIYCPAIGR